MARLAPALCAALLLVALPPRSEAADPLPHRAAETVPPPSATAAPADTGDLGDGPTEAPDLLAVDNFRPGLPDDDGHPQTLVDFTFDQAAYLNGGDRSAFALIPLDGGLPRPARSVAPPTDTAGDAVVTVLFRGVLQPSDVARGAVQAGVVNSAPDNVSSEHPANVRHTEPVSSDGRTDNPELVRITRDGDQVLFAFDEALTTDDVVQNTAGLRVYFPETDAASTIRTAAAQAVRQTSPTVLRALFSDDLPEDKTLADAVGGFVMRGAVQAARGSRGANDGVNALTELAPVTDTGAEICPPSPHAGETGDRSGPTEGPDLLAVENVRRGPFTSQFTPTTCVDFVFDQPVYLNGGDRSNFRLVPLDADDAVSGTTNVRVPADTSGDVVVTVAFPGDFDRGAFARGFVDSGVANSDPSNVGAAAPANVSQAEALAATDTTANPDLVSITKDGDQVFFEFDEPLTTDDVIQSTSGLRIYFPETDAASTIRAAGAQAVKRKNPTTLRAFFGRDLPEGKTLDDAVGGYVDQGTVQSAVGSRGGNDGKSAFDETVPITDTGAEVCPPSPLAGETGDRSGPTEGPDLLAVENVRRGPFTSQFTPTTCVDFVFDQPVYLNGGDRSNFRLVPRDAGDAVSGTPNVRVPADTAGDVVVTVAFPGDFDRGAFARGFVDSGVVNSDPSNVGAEVPANVSQAEALAATDTTANPDLVSITKDGDQVFFEFDEPLTTDDVIQSTSGLRIYFPETDAASTIRAAGAQAVKRKNPTTLRAFFGRDLPEGKTLDDAVGGYVDQGTVQSAAGSRGGNDGKSAFDETVPITDTGAEVCPPSPLAGETGDRSGPTEGPDLLAVENVRRGPFTSQFTPTTCVDFVFDQPVYLNGGDRSNFRLVPLDADDAVSGTPNVRVPSDTAGDVVVTVAFPGDFDADAYARGFVDSGVANSKRGGAGAEHPLNVNQSGPIAPETATANPDLAGVTREGDAVRFTFDEPLTDDDVIQSTSGLRLYFPATSQSSTIPNAGAQRVERVDATTLRAFYTDLPEGYALDDAVGAYVVQGTVQSAAGTRGGNDGKSAFVERALR